MSAPRTPGPAGGRDPDAGDTLLEILISVAILGIVSAALIGGFLTAISSSTVYRAVASADTVLRTAVDSITTQMQQNATAAFGCPADASVYAVSGLPAGYSSQVNLTPGPNLGVSYWVNGAPQATCVAEAPQLITVAVTYTSPHGGSTSTNRATFTVDDPQAAPAPTYGGATQLVFLSSGGPSNTTAGSAIPNQPLVAVEDAQGHVVTTDLSPVILSITPNTGTPGAQLANCTGTEFYGVVNYRGCEIDQAGSGYSLTATDGALPPTTSQTFTVNPGPTTSLVFSQSPVTNTAGSAFSRQPMVTLRDAYGNTATGDTSTVTLAITSGTGTAGANLTCNPSNDQQAASAGLATFSGCAIDKAGNGYTLTATDGSLTSATSTAFGITAGPPAKLVFTTEPAGTITGGSAFPTQPVVTIEDAGGNTVTSNTSTVTLSITPNTGGVGASLTCNPSNDQQAASAGVATFAGCTIDKVGNGYTLTATDGNSNITAATSTAFAVGIGAAAKLVFTTEPGGTITGGGAFPTQPVVAIEDAGGNTVTSSTSTVTLSITSGTGTSGASLTCNPSNDQQTASAGVATFAGCAINKVGNGYTLTATDGSLTSATSSAFAVGAGAAAKLVFTQQPSGTISGSAFPTQPIVTIEDAAGNTVTSNTSTVTLSITSGTGTAGASLTCNPSNQRAASAGVATFAGCAINKVGTGYTLTATDGSLTAATSTAFTVNGPAAKLVFTTGPPSSIGKNTSFTTVVTVEDAAGNTATNDNSAVTLTINGTNSSHFSCNPSNPQQASAGVATFSCAISRASTDTLTATDGSLMSATSSSITVS